MGIVKFGRFFGAELAKIIKVFVKKKSILGIVDLSVSLNFLSNEHSEIRSIFRLQYSTGKMAASIQWDTAANESFPLLTHCSGQPRTWKWPDRAKQQQQQHN